VNKSFVVGDFVMPTSTVRVRFSVADIGTPSIVEAGIDNFTVEEIICTPTPTCHGDITGDNLVNVNDLLAVINAWGPCPPSVPCPADFVPPGGDGVVNVNDLLGVINAWGPCGK
jgi:hypothetical protein